jgi:hypothetical protein
MVLRRGEVISMEHTYEPPACVQVGDYAAQTWGTGLSIPEGNSVLGLF